jgi:hypothetical protein
VNRILKVVSVSLGSSKRNKTGEIELLGHRISIERIGCDGEVRVAENIIRKIDGKVDVITLGGVDRYFVVSGKKYEIPVGRQLAMCAKKTPVVDGSVIKNTFERIVIQQIIGEGIIKNISIKKY